MRERGSGGQRPVCVTQEPVQLSYLWAFQAKECVRVCGCVEERRRGKNDE